MADDIRISLGFWSHHKTVKLKRRVGLEGVESLLKLWAWTAQNRPNGALTCMDIEDLEIAAGWAGEPGTFIAILHELRWLDHDGDTYSVHGWEEHQPWVVGSGARKQKASSAARARWEKTKEEHQECSEHAPSMPTAMPSTVPYQDQYQDQEKLSPLTPHRDADPEDPALPVLSSFATGRESMSSAERQERAMAWPPETSYRDDATFERFWEAYPWKVGKRAAIAAWRRIESECRDVTPERIIAAIKAHVAGRHFDNLDGTPAVPSPAKWLEAGRWDDVIKPPGQSDSVGQGIEELLARRAKQ